MPNLCGLQIRGLPEYVRATTVGDNLRIRIYIAGADNLPLADIGTSDLTLKVKPPTAAATDYEEGDLTADGDGNWYVDHILDEGGEWIVRAEITGDYVDADERRFRVPDSALAS